MRDVIEVEKSEIPCSYDIVLGAEEFTLLFKYNSECDLFTCSLSRTESGEVLVYDEPIIYGVPLFQDVYESDTFPCVDIVPFDESNSENKVTYDNFNEKVFLTIDDEGDSTEEDIDGEDYNEEDYYNE